MRTLKGSNKAEMFQVLYENWISANGKWDQSQIVVQCRSTVKGSKTGARRWMLRSDIVSKYGSEGIADDIIQSKLSDPMLKSTCVRDHPDLPGRPELQLFLCWDSSHECDTEDTVVEQMFTMSQKHDEREGQGKTNKGHEKKRKRSTSSSSSVSMDTSSSSSDSDSSSDDTSSSGAKKKSKKSKNNKKAKKGKNAGKKSKKPKEDKKDKKDKKHQDKEKKTTAVDEAKQKAKDQKKAEKEEEKQRKKDEREQKQKMDKEKNELRAKGRKAHS